MQSKTFSSLFADPLQSTLISHTYSLYGHSVKYSVCFAPRWWS